MSNNVKKKTSSSSKKRTTTTTKKKTVKAKVNSNINLEKLYDTGVVELPKKKITRRVDKTPAIEETGMKHAKKEIPNLLRMYLNLGHKVSAEGSIDYKFNSCDVLIIMDSKEINMRYFERLMRIGSIK